MWKKCDVVMLYDSKSCSNSYYWVHLTFLVGALFVVSVLIFLIYSLYLIIKSKIKGEKKKFNIVLTLLCFALYVGGIFLSLDHALDSSYGIVPIVLGTLVMAIYRKNICYLFLTYIVPYLYKNDNLAIYIGVANIFLLLGVTFYNFRVLNKKQKKIGAIVFGISFLLLACAIGVGFYVASSRPDSYCWGS